MALLVGAWAAAAAVLLLGTRDDAFEGRAAVEEATRFLLDGDLVAARAAFETGEAAFSDAAAGAGSPVLAPLRVMPLAGPNIRAVGAMAEAGALGAEAGRELSAALIDIPGGIEALGPQEGAVPLEPFEALAAPTDRAHSLLAEADDILRTLPADGLVTDVAEARDSFGERLAEARDMAGTVAVVVERLPAFLGADEPKRYLFGAQNPAELRGTGGLVGAYSILEIDDGLLEFGDFGPIHDLPFLPAGQVEPPNADWPKRYDRFGGAGHWLNINMTPDFPSAATAMERLYEAGTGEALDGTILADPMALQSLLQVAGPTEIPLVGPVDANNVVAVVANEAYDDFEEGSERKRVLGDVAAAALGGFLRGEGGADPVETARALRDALSGGHLLAHAADPAIQEMLVTSGVAGELLDPDGDFVAVFGNNTAHNKVDFYADRRVEHEVDLLWDRTAMTRTTVEIANDAPTEGLPRHVIGDAGDNRTIVSAYCGRDCTLDHFRRDGDRPAVVEEELGHQVVSAQVVIPSGSSERLQYDWLVDSAWEGDDVGGVYRFTFQDQVMFRPTTLRLSVKAPAGMVPVDVGPDVSVENGRVTWEGPVDSVQTLEIRFATPGTEVPGGWDRVRDALGRVVIRVGDA